MNWRLLNWFALSIIILAACDSTWQPPVPIAISPGPGGGSARAPMTVGPTGRPNYTGCYYVWATRELPELSEIIQAKFEQLNSEILASAYAFGEECRQDDGTVTFLPMETDFRLRIPVSTLTDDAVLGEWISRSMSVIEALPFSDAPGTRPGRLEFEFWIDATSVLRLTVEISRYRTEAAGLDSASIFKLFRAAP